jgi:DnaJ-class molecular chaperone
MVGGKRCAGRNKREMRKSDWKECKVCSATGLVRAGTCERCDGAGWLFVRRQRR